MVRNSNHAGGRRAFLANSLVLAAAAAMGPAVWAAEAAVQPRTLHPYPNKVVWGRGSLSFKQRVQLTVSGDADAEVVAMMKETWTQFTLGAVELSVTRDAALKAAEFSLAVAPPPQREPNATYALTVGGTGVGASAADPAAMRHAWFSLLQLMEANDADDGGITFTFPQVEIQDWPTLKFRALHLCIFHETTPLMIEKAIRLAAFYKFSHIVLEFWGMIQLDTMKELAWPGAWTKAQAAKLVAIARGMGLEVIPTFNCWGHGSGSRVKGGRHVVLDQNPKLAPLFEPDGWTWCLTNPQTQGLLRKVCDEMIELAGPGRFFHIGCDEAYSHATCEDCRETEPIKLFAEHVNNMAAYLEKQGRRSIMWGDALLETGKWPPGFTASGSAALPTHQALEQISHKIMIADWHYGVTQGAVPTLAHFREHGFETIACPWNSAGNIRTLAKAAYANNSAGLMMTTWHHLVQSIPLLPYVANSVWSQSQTSLGLRQMEWALMVGATASHLRKLMPAGGEFERAGWNTFEMPAETD